MSLPTIVRRAAALADDTRVRIVHELVAGEATVSDLGARIMLPQPRISTHLKILLTAGLVTVEPAGRQRVYRVEARWITQILMSLNATDAGLPPLGSLSHHATREVRRNSAIRQARSCYGHLAGIAGVQLLEEFLKRQWLTVQSTHGRPQYALSPEGLRALSRRGIELESVTAERRVFAYGCPDWSERRPHLAGALGTGVFRALKAVGVVRQFANSRVVTLVRPLQDWFDDRLLSEIHSARQIQKKARQVA